MDDVLNQNILDELAISYATDKSSRFHNYTHVYNMIFNSIKDKNLTVLEIGVLNGSSVKMWSDYFKNSKIVGIDVDELCKNYITNKIAIEIGNQTDINFLKYIKNTYPDIDILIDDGGHTWHQQKTTFIDMFPHIKSGGYYIIEDLTTSYLKGTVWDTNEESTVDFLKRIVDDVNLNGKSIVGTLEADVSKLNIYELSIEYILFYKGICIIKKRDHELI